jgi:N,N-dimethylformamidase
MIIGNVSDEHYVAINETSIEFTQNDKVVAQTKTFISGAVDVDLPAGKYRMTLGKAGFASKHVDITLPVAEPIKFRLISEKLVAYMWPKWSKSGEISTLRVNSASPVRFELFRYGLKRESHGVITWLDDHGPRALLQIIPDDDITQVGVQFNKIGYPWGPMTWPVTAPEKSGLYYVHAENEAGEFFSFPWVVAPKKPTAKIAVLAATNNWNAYNNYGGRSNYINPDGLPPHPTVNARQDLSRYTGHIAQNEPNDVYPPISFMRPELECSIAKDEEVTDPMGRRLASTLAPGLWRLLAWLEREGYDYDIYRDAQLANGTLDLSQYKTLLTEMHPEYWYREEYEIVKDWVFNKGGRFMYLGGNGIDCEVEYTDDSRARYLTDQTDTIHDPAVARGEKKALYENRFHKSYESVAPLLGVVFTGAGEGTAAPFEVKDASHWIYEGTGLKNGDQFGRNSLHERIPGGASGHETDKTTSNTPKAYQTLAVGLNPGVRSGSELGYMEFPGKGGKVFSTGSITYVSCLLVDELTSKITKNVLNKFLQD